jgi:energy-coupling factor transporter ATP-binding protein EcfA2
MLKTRILHTADIQVKLRERDLTKPYASVLAEIRDIIVREGVEVYLLAGDLTEYAASNDAEKKAIYNHLSECLAIPTLVEICVMNGNHDLHDMRKALEAEKGHNAVDTFKSFIDKLEPELSKKVTYLKEQRYYRSRVEGLGWISYSLEDGPSNGANIKAEGIDPYTFNICVYHDILREYVDATKLPVKKDRYERLASVEDFLSTLTLAGDIHVNWTVQSIDKSKTFIYPGSPIQRDHSEGTFAKVRNKPGLAVGDQKVVKIIDIENGSWTVRDEPLTNLISYVTFDMTTSSVSENWLQQVLAVLRLDSVWGTCNTFIKFKLSSTYSKHELELIRVTHELGSQRMGTVSVNCQYDKFVMNQSEVQPTEAVTEGEGEEPEETMDEMVLDEAKLHALFVKVLEGHKKTIEKEFVEEEDVNEILAEIRQLFSEQLSNSLTKTSNYVNELESIECNCFMALGKNKIKLNIPGLTRITGTNGIGKTTMYNMLRWVLKDEIMEGMPKAKKVQNSLHLFNDKLPEIDTIMVRLIFRANGTKVHAIRWAQRAWKQNTTDEMKRSLNWKQYVSGVTRNLKLQVHKEGAEPVEKIGDEAQQLLDRWFGEVPNTIMILNQAKILSMLNMPPAELTQMVLNYIGVDYLQVLEGNLASVKSYYDLVKPKVNMTQLKEEIIMAIADRNAAQNKIELLDDSKAFTENRLNHIRRAIAEGHQKKLELGNVPTLIKEQQVKVDNAKAAVDSFESREKREEPIFTETEPIEPDTKEADKEEIEILADEIGALKTVNEAYADDIAAMWDILEKQTQAEIDGGWEEVTKEYWRIEQDYANAAATAKIELDTAGGAYLDAVRETHEVLQAKEKTFNEKVQEIKDRQKALSDRLSSNKNQLESGICPTCNKPISGDAGHWEVLKQRLKDDNEAIVIELTQITPELEKQQSLAAAAKTHVDTYGILASVASAESDWNTVLAEHASYNDAIRPLAVATVTARDKWNRLKTTAEAAKEQKKDYSADENLYIELDVITARLTKLAALREVTLRKDATLLVFDEQAGAKAKLDMWTKGAKDSSDKMALLYQGIEKIVRAATEATEKYSKDLKSYGDRLKTHNEALDAVRRHNLTVDEHNRSIDQLKQTHALEASTLENLRLKEPMWDEAVAGLDEQERNERDENESMSVMNTQRAQHSLALQRHELKIESNEKLIREYVEWQRKSMVFAIYEKLIKRDFKDIVFNYYRSFLNNTLNLLLEGLSFKLFWDESGELYMVEMKDGHAVFRPVQLVSGMETAFQGLALIYAISTLNVKNSVSCIFIDELSGQLNSGKELSKKENIVNYQEMFITLLNRFESKNLFVIDHNLEQMFETHAFQVIPSEKGSMYIDIN